MNIYIFQDQKLQINNYLYVSGPRITNNHYLYISGPMFHLIIIYIFQDQEFTNLIFIVQNFDICLKR